MGTRALGPIVFLVSAAVLAFQVVLLRLFAIETFHHFAYMAVGVALLGFGASGTLVVLLRSRVRGREDALFELSAAAFPVALLGAAYLAGSLEFEPTQLLWDRGQWYRLGVLYAGLTLPFFLAATAIMLALGEAGERVGRIYAWNMVGSGAGGALALLLLIVARPDRALGGVAALAAAAGSLAILARRRSVVRAALAVALLGIGAATLWRSPWTLEVNPFKGLPQIRAHPGARQVAEKWSPTGWAVAVRSPSFHHAPGLSLAYPGELPPQVALFVDGGTAGAATGWIPEGGAGPHDPARSEALRFLDWLPTSAPYAVAPAPSVLVVGSAGGTEILNALRHGADSVTGVELVGPLVELPGEVSAAGENPYRNPRVRLVVGDARAHAAGPGAPADVVQLPPTGGFGVAAAGVYAAGEDYLNTVQGYATFLRRLAPGGILAVTDWLATPPRRNVKVLLTAAEALRATGTERVGPTMVFLRSWATGTLLVKPGGFTPDELRDLRTFARDRRMDVDWPPPPPGADPPTFNRLERPVFREAAAAAVAGPDSAAAFAAGYPFRVAPATDDRPYFHHFLRPERLPGLLGGGRGAMLPFAEWGYLAVVATLIQSGLLASVLLALPALVLTRGTEREEGQRRAGLLRIAAYFSAVGLGFAFVEMTAIHRLGLVLGHPVYATSATLAALLVFSGLGSAASDRGDAARGRWACLGVAALALAGALLVPRAGAVLPLPFWVRAVLATATVGGLGFLMGWPFPTGLRRLAPEGTPVAWAWAANGFASVVGVSLATLLSMELGGGSVLALAGVCYAAAFLVLRRE